MEMVVSIRGLTQAYGQTRVLNGIHLDLPKNSLTHLTGPNGAGKTTLLKCLAGLLQPLEGSITWFTQQPTVVLFTPGTSLYEDLTVQENLNLYRILYGSSISHMDRLLDQFSIDSLLKKRVRHLSHGQKMRAALVRTFLQKSDLILLDEPFTGLDQDSSNQLTQYLGQLKKDHTVVLATHQSDSIKSLVDKTLRMEEGGILS